MPELGDFTQGRNIGKGCNQAQRHIWHACIDCGKERWVACINKKPMRLRCKSCSKKGTFAYNWKDGRGISSGYIKVKLELSDSFYPMTNKLGRVREHRLVMAKHLDRCLGASELIHHKNRNRSDNSIENLEIVTRNNHAAIHIQETLNKQTEKIESLEKEIRLLRLQISLLSEKSLI